MLEHANIPDEWTRGVICLISKKNKQNRWDYNNYRGISFMNVVSKVYNKTVT
jgi:hypothetical protein